VAAYSNYRATGSSSLPGWARVLLLVASVTLVLGSIAVVIWLWPITARVHVRVDADRSGVAELHDPLAGDIGELRLVRLRNPDEQRSAETGPGGIARFPNLNAGDYSILTGGGSEYPVSFNILHKKEHIPVTATPTPTSTPTPTIPTETPTSSDRPPTPGVCPSPHSPLPGTEMAGVVDIVEPVGDCVPVDRQQSFTVTWSGVSGGPDLWLLVYSPGIERYYPFLCATDLGPNGQRDCDLVFMEHEPYEVIAVLAEPPGTADLDVIRRAGNGLTQAGLPKCISEKASLSVYGPTPTPTPTPD